MMRSIAPVIAWLLLSAAGCASVPGPRPTLELDPIDDRMSCWVDAPESVRTRRPFPIRLSVQNVSAQALRVGVSRSPLRLYLWCDKDRERKHPLLACPSSGAAPPRPEAVLESLPPGQSVVRDIDLNEEETWVPGQCHFGDMVSLDVQVGDELHSHRVHCSVPASVEITP